MRSIIIAILLLVTLITPSLVLSESRPVTGILKRRYVHRCPPGTEQIGGGPPVSTMVFCREILSKGSRLEGDYTTFYRNGNKKIEGAYSQGKKNGEWKNFKNNGELLNTISYDKGKIIKRDSTLKLKKNPPKVIEKKEFYEDKEVFEKFNQTRLKDNTSKQKKYVYGIGAK